jgi:KaiC/GvpD/RAD55 family RecA-like ATPase
LDLKFASRIRGRTVNSGLTIKEMDRIKMPRRVVEFKFKGGRPIGVIKNKMVQPGSGRHQQERRELAII